MINFEPIPLDTDNRLTWLFDTRILQLLLAGACFLLGGALSRREKIDMREKAYLVRRVVAAVEREHRVEIKNIKVLQVWTGDYSPHWHISMGKLWLWAAPLAGRLRHLAGAQFIFRFWSAVLRGACEARLVKAPP